MILFKPILINHLYLIIYPSMHKLTSAHLHKKRSPRHDQCRGLYFYMIPISLQVQYVAAGLLAADALAVQAALRLRVCRNRFR